MFGVTTKNLGNLRGPSLKDIVPLCTQCTSLFSPKLNYREASSAAYCLELVKRRDYEHYLTSLLLPDRVRPMGFALRALSIEISSIRDNVSDSRIGKMRIQFWKDAVDNFQKAKETSGSLENCRIPNNPVLIELHKCLLQHPHISFELLHRLVQSREIFMSDQRQPFKSMDDVERYSEYAFSSINNILLESLIDSDDKLELNGHARHSANQLGKAEGIITILKGLPYNISRKSVYLPQNLLVSHKISTENIIRGIKNEELFHVIEVCAAAAEENLENCRFRKKYLNNDEKRIMLAAVPIDSYLSKLSKVKCNIYDKDLLKKDAWLPFKLYVQKWKKSY